MSLRELGALGTCFMYLLMFIKSSCSHLTSPFITAALSCDWPRMLFVKMLHSLRACFTWLNKIKGSHGHSGTRRWGKYDRGEVIVERDGGLNGLWLKYCTFANLQNCMTMWIHSSSSRALEGALMLKLHWLHGKSAPVSDCFSGWTLMDLCVMCLNTMLKVNNNRTLFHFCFVWNVIVSNCWHIPKCCVLNHRAFCWYVREFLFLQASWAMTHCVYQKVSSCHCGRKFR